MIYLLLSLTLLIFSSQLSADCANVLPSGTTVFGNDFHFVPTNCNDVAFCITQNNTTIDGNGATLFCDVQLPGCTAIQVDPNVQGVIIKNLNIVGFLGTAIVFQDGDNNVLVDNCNLTFCGGGIDFQGTDENPNICDFGF